MFTGSTGDNVFPGIFETAVLRLNPGLNPEDVRRLLDEIHLDLQNEDLGKAFHKRLVARSGVRLVDLDNPDNNSYHAVTELPFESGEDNLRPDITLLINGLPLAIIEVKKRMNLGGILEERRRMDRRHANRKFPAFFNLIQLLVFSNNMEYDDASIEPRQGAFYASIVLWRSALQLFPRRGRSELATRSGNCRRVLKMSSSPTTIWSASRTVRNSPQQSRRHADQPLAHLAVQP